MSSTVVPNRKDSWKRRFSAPRIVYSRIATGNPPRGIVVTNRDGPYQIYAWDVATGALAQRTERPEGLINADLSPDGRFIYYLDDRQGDEIGHYVRVPFQGGQPEDITPNLPPFNAGFSYRHPSGLALARVGNRAAFTAGTDDGFRIYVMELVPDGGYGEPAAIYHTESLISAPLISASGDTLVVASKARYSTPQFSLLAFDAETGEQIGELWEGEENSTVPLFFSPSVDDTRVVALTDRSGNDRLLLWNPRSGERVDPSLPEIEGAMLAFDWSPDGARILFRTTNAARQQLHVYEIEAGQVTTLGASEGTNFSPYFSPDPNLIYSHLTTAAEPAQLVALNAWTGAREKTILQPGPVPGGRPWNSFTFSSADGQEIQGWLAVPHGDGPFPLILNTHGGPQAVRMASFSPEAQAWLDHGFAWATVNYRGSTTFGKAFEEQIWGNPGDLEVQDMVAARRYLVQEGVADPRLVFPTGWSYGGYLTLQALGKCPDLWAGGIAGVAISDWRLSYEDSSATLRKYCAALLGGTPEEKPEQYARSSPVTYHEQITAPVLIIQGEGDTRTPARPIRIFAEKMKALGKAIQVHWFNAGHAGAFTQVEQAVRHQELMLHFARDIVVNANRPQ